MLPHKSEAPTFPSTCFRLSPLVVTNLLIGLALGVVMASCGSDSHPLEVEKIPSGPSGWFWQNPLPQGNPLNDVAFADANTATAVGYLGTVLRTTDGGATWVSQTSGTTNPLYDVSFTDANTGVVVGPGGTILGTTDAGATWVTQASGTMYSLQAVSFTNANMGTVVGESGTIVRTVDGGGR
jgi:photosystem II stability/assembly factor-like uncharacterized protein